MGKRGPEPQYANRAERQKAYRERQKEKTRNVTAPLPLMPTDERAYLREALLEAADLLQAATKPKKRIKGQSLIDAFDTPQDIAKRRADSIRQLVDVLAL